MRILFLGGSGVISTACAQLALARGHHVALLNRGRRELPFAPSEIVVADLQNEEATRVALGDRRWDVVIDFLSFQPADIERGLRLFQDRVGHFIFISSASAYQKPVSHYVITESTPLANPLWDYSRAKIACEELLIAAYREDGFPVTIVRPSLTYGETQITLAINSWEKSFTAVDRLRRGLPVIIPGDGTSLWTITHNSDFAKGLIGLLGNAQSFGHAFHITSDEVQTWNQYYALVAEAAGVKSPRFIHIATDFIAACLPEKRGGLAGDKSVSAVFDNRKIKQFVPDFVATTPFHVGIEKTMRWFDADPKRQLVDELSNQDWDRLIKAYETGLGNAVLSFQR